jgi:hypothetical protein
MFTFQPGAVLNNCPVVTPSRRLSAGITFEKSWKDICDAFLSHWLVYVAWLAVAGFLPMAGGAMLGLVRTRFLTRPVTTMHDEDATEVSPRQPEMG